VLRITEGSEHEVPGPEDGMYRPDREGTACGVCRCDDKPYLNRLSDRNHFDLNATLPLRRFLSVEARFRTAYTGQTSHIFHSIASARYQLRDNAGPTPFLARSLIRCLILGEFLKVSIAIPIAHSDCLLSQGSQYIDDQMRQSRDSSAVFFAYVL